MAKKLSSLPTEIIRTIDIDSVFNEVYLPYLNNIWKREAYYGGGSAGKSKFIAQKLAMQMSAIPGRNLVCLRHVKAVCDTSVYPELWTALEDFHLLEAWNFVESPNISGVNLTNGNEILFLGMDSVEKLKSLTFKHGNLTDIWYEEISEETDVRNIRQLEVRLRGGFTKKRLIVSYNPVSAQHFIKDMCEKEWKRKYGDDMVYLKTTYKDNKFLNDDDKQTLEDFKFSDPYMYQVYCMGEYGSSGQSVFDRNKVSERMQELGTIYQENPPRVVDFEYDRDTGGHILPESFKPFDTDTGETKIFIEPVPRHPYAMSLDPSGEGADFTAGHVFDNYTGEQVAVIHSALNPDRAVHQAFGLAKYYNDAFFVPEVNMESFFLLEFKRLGYSNIYQRGTPLDAYSEGYEQKLGFVTHGGNRKTMLSDCVKWANQNMNMISDVDTLNEMLSFAKLPEKKQGFIVGFKLGASPGTHDDLVMSLAVLLQGRQQCSVELSKEIDGTIEGVWYPTQLKMAMEAGRITPQQKKEYEKSHSDHRAFKRSAKTRRSRYDR